MDDSYLYRYRPRVTGEQSAYSWYPHAPRRKPREPEFEHQCASYQKIGTQRSDFIVSPEWISDEMNRDTIVQSRGRRWKPCPWEFPGARQWPYMNNENRLDEQRQLRALLTSREAPQEARPVTGREREELNPPMRVRLIPQQSPWRPKTSWKAYVANEEAGVFGDPSRAPNLRPKSVAYSRHVNNFEDYKYTHGYEEFYDHESPYNFHHPDDVGVTGGSHVKRYDVTSRVDKENAFSLHPNIAAHERPRFERPFYNSANAMWVGVKYASSPGQN